MLSDPIVVAILASIGGVVASSGFWGWIQSRDKTKNGLVRLLLALAYDKIKTDGMAYLERGWISREEYEDIRQLFDAYKILGGNGVAEQVMNQVSQLKMRGPARYAEINNKVDRDVELTNDR